MTETLRVEEVAGRVDFVIMTVREDEFEAVISRMEGRRPVLGGRQRYEFATLGEGDRQRTIAAVRQLEQGQSAAQATATRALEDLRPRWLLLVGIAGGVPDAEFTLGDVLLASRVHDFSVSAAIEGGQSSYQQLGGPMHRNLEPMLAHLPAMRERLGPWNREDQIGLLKPTLQIDEERLYGSPEYRIRTRNALLAGFPPGQSPREPLFRIGPSAGGSVLVKDTELVRQWQESARQLTHIEMEAGGAYRAAHDADCPLLCVRGISDIVGFKRDPVWTAYACHSAASFTMALLRSEAIDFPPKPPFEQSPSATTAATSPVRRISAASSSPPDLGLLVSTTEASQPSRHVYWPYDYRYETVTTDESIVIAAKSEFFRALQDATPLPETTFDTGGGGPFGLVFPELELTLLNNSGRPIVINEVAAEVEKGEPDLTPIILASSRSFAPRKFCLVNVGWGPVEPSKLAYDLQVDSASPQATFDSHRFLTEFESFEHFVEVDVSDALAKDGVDVAALKALTTSSSGIDFGGRSVVQLANDPSYHGTLTWEEHHQRVRAAYGPYNTSYGSGKAKVFGTWTYRNGTSGTPAVYRFTTTVSLFGNEASDLFKDDLWYQPYRIELPKWDLLLRDDLGVYTRKLPVNLVVKAGEVGMHRVRVAASRSSKHTLRFRVRYNSRDSVLSETVELQVMVPRSNARALEAAIENPL